VLNQRADKGLVYGGMVEEKGNPQEGMVYKYAIYGSDVCIVSPGEEFCLGLLIGFWVKVKVDLHGPRMEW
jgi:hypothetical protein